MKLVTKLVGAIAVGVVASALFAAPSFAGVSPNASMVEYATHASPNASMVEYAAHVSPDASMVEY